MSEPWARPHTPITLKMSELGGYPAHRVDGGVAEDTSSGGGGGGGGGNTAGTATIDNTEGSIKRRATIANGVSSAERDRRSSSSSSSSPMAAAPVLLTADAPRRASTLSVDSLAKPASTPHQSSRRGSTIAESRVAESKEISRLFSKVSAARTIHHAHRTRSPQPSPIPQVREAAIPSWRDGSDGVVYYDVTVTASGGRRWTVSRR